MKRTILSVISLILLCGMLVRAQVPANGSRLSIPTNRPISGLDNRALVPKPTVLSYKPLALQKPQALNNYYRALLFNTTNSISDASENIVVSSALAEKSERRALNAEEKTKVAEDQLFANEWITVSNVYPNPASDYAEFDYTIQNSTKDAKIVILNILSSPIAEFVLDRNARKLRVNTREVPTNIYFYSLILDGKPVATKKMLVRHQQ